MAYKRTDRQKQIANTMGPRNNMNGAGEGGRFVAKRTKINGRNVVLPKDRGKTQMGSREQRRQDLRRAFGLPG